MIDNGSNTSVALEPEREGAPVAGVGVEYATRAGLAVRAEAVTFAADARYAQLGAVYRFGRSADRGRTAMTEVVAEADAPVPAAALPAPAPAVRDCVAELADVRPRVNFDYASTRPLVPLAERFGPVVEALRACPEARVTISGHADDRSPLGRNREVSERRAQAVEAYLVERGIEPSRIRTRGYAETRPVADNGSETGRLLNRRVELDVVR